MRCSCGGDFFHYKQQRINGNYVWFVPKAGLEPAPGVSQTGF